MFGSNVGAEFNVNFDAAGVPQLYSSADGQTLVQQTVDFTRSADGAVLEFAGPA